MTIVLLCVYFSLQMTGQVLAKFSSAGESIFNIHTLGSYTCFLLRGFLWILILNRLKLIVAYPISGLSYILILPVSLIFFGEEIGRTSLVSSLLIGIGVVALALGEYFSPEKKGIEKGAEC